MHIGTIKECAEINSCSAGNDKQPFPSFHHFDIAATALGTMNLRKQDVLSCIPKQDKCLCQATRNQSRIVYAATLAALH